MDLRITVQHISTTKEDYMNFKLYWEVMCQKNSIQTSNAGWNQLNIAATQKVILSEEKLVFSQVDVIESA